MKRFISVLLAAMMILSVVSISVFAVTTIGTVTLNIPEPKANYRPATSAGNDVFSATLTWTDVTDGTTLPSTSAFVAGHVYKVRATLKIIDSSYAFSSSLKVVINGTTVTYNASGKYCEYTFAKIPGTDPGSDVITIGSVSLDIPVPKLNYLPSTDVESTVFEATLTWTDLTTGTAMDTTKPFQAGHQYKVKVVIKPASSKYAFSSSLTVTINGEKVTYNKTGSYCEYTFPKLPDADPGTDVTTIAAVNMTIPEPKADFYPGGVIESGAFKATLVWTDITDNKEIDSATPFCAGHQYKVKIVIKPISSKYVLASDLEVTVNNEVVPYNASGSYCTVTFPKIPDAPKKYTLTIAVTAAGSKLDDTNITLLSGTETLMSNSYAGSKFNLKVEGLVAGDYTVKVSKKGCVDATYKVTIKGDTTLEVNIEEEKPLLLGDVDGDGKVNAADYNAFKKIALGIVAPTTDQMKTADLNGDGKINAADANILKKLILGVM